jgi:hypothetical protein
MIFETEALCGSYASTQLSALRRTEVLTLSKIPRHS